MFSSTCERKIHSLQKQLTSPSLKKQLWQTCSRTHARTHTRTHARTHAHTHTHTHTGELLDACEYYLLKTSREWEKKSLLGENISFCNCKTDCIHLNPVAIHTFVIQFKIIYKLPHQSPTVSNTQRTVVYC